MTITYDGNVGIGTSSNLGVNGALTVYEATNARLFLADNTLGTSYGGQVRGYGVGGAGGNLSLGSVDANTYNEAIRVLNQSTAIQFFINSGANGTTTERARIDASGHLLVGKTSNDSGTAAGAILGSSGVSRLTADGDHPLVLKRKTSDGTILQLEKDGSVVGSNRFKDLYLSGGLRGDTTFKNNAGTTEYARFDASGDLLVGTTTSPTSPSNTAVIVSGGVRTASNLLSSIASGTATTAFSITSGNRGRYEVVAMIANSGDASLYSAISTVLWDGSTGRAVSNNGTNFTITLSGSNVQVTQTSGSAQNVYWSVQRIAL
jgi:hypothetical protein